MPYLAILLMFVFFAGIAMTVNEGLWNNAIALLSILLAGLFAVFGGVPFGNFLAEQMDKGPANHWYFVFAGMWGVFALAILVIRLVAEQASKIRLRLVPVIDKIAGPILGVLVAVMLTSFATFTLVHGPIKAGEWKYEEAADWQKSVFTYGRAPFLSVINQVAKTEGIDSPLLKP